MMLTMSNSLRDPISATMERVKELSEHGVGGTTEDDMGEDRTDAWPKFMERSEFSQEQRQAIQNRLLHPSGTLKEFCERFGHDYTQTSKLLKRVRKTYEPELKDHGIYERLVPPSKRGAESGEEQVNDEEQRERVRMAWKKNPHAKAAQIKDVADADDLSINQVSALKQKAISDAAASDLETEASTDIVAELRRLRQEIDDLKLQLLADDGQPSDDPRVGELDEDTLFAIITSDDLSPEQRRQVFELVVD